MSQFKKTYDGTKLKTNLKLAINRLKLLEKKKTEQGIKGRKEISEYLQALKIDRARIRVEGIIREDYLIEAFEMIEMTCEVLHGRIGILETSSNEAPPADLEEYLCGILFAAPRIYQEVPEMVVITKELQRKFKKDVFANLQQNANRKANPRLATRLDIRPPPKSLVEQYLVAIAKSHKIEFEPDPLALDGSVDRLSSSDFRSPGQMDNSQPHAEANGSVDLINLGSDHPKPPFTECPGPGYPTGANQFPQAPSLNPNYPSSSSSNHQPGGYFPNSQFPPPPANYMPPNSGVPAGYAQQPYRPPQTPGLDNKSEKYNMMPPPSYEESDESIRPHSDSGSRHSGMNSTDASAPAPVHNNNLQQWSNLASELPQIPTDIGGGGPPGGGNNNTNGGGGGGGGVTGGDGGENSSLDMDDLEARLNRLKGP